MDDQKRLLFATAAVAIFLFIWFEYFVPKPKPVVGKVSQSATTQTPTSQNTVPSSTTPLAAATNANGARGVSDQNGRPGSGLL